jgi:hypothetical protein
VIGPIDVPDNIGYRRPLSLLSTHDNTKNGYPFPSTLCLAALAYTEYFPWDRSVDASKDDRVSLKDRVSEAILHAVPRWCGTYGAPPSPPNGPGGLSGTRSDGYDGYVNDIGGHTMLNRPPMTARDLMPPLPEVVPLEHDHDPRNRGVGAGAGRWAQSVRGASATSRGRQ